MDQLNLITVSGRRYAMIAGQKIEVVVVNTLEAAHMILPGFEGAYVLGSGSVGVAQTFFIMGITYLLVMVIAVLSLRIPAPGWVTGRPDGTEYRKRSAGHATTMSMSIKL